MKGYGGKNSTPFAVAQVYQRLYLVTLLADASSVSADVILTIESATETEETVKDTIKACSLAELETIILELGQPKYRAQQVYDWLHTHNVSSYDDMTNIPKTLRQVLSDRFPLAAPVVKDSRLSKDGSVKYVVEFPDNVVAETVAIIDGPSHTLDDNRVTVCVSSQAGCAMECAFCATGRQGFTRNLDVDEIVSQVILASNDLGQRVSNVVVMGQGEPFLNYEAVISAMRRLNQDKGLTIGARHITVSTSGIVDGIYDFAEEPEQFRLAISLHSADQTTRNELMPRLSGQPLHALKKALSYYCAVKGRRITLEYMLLKDVNDSDEQLARLIEFCKGLNVHVNLLTYNPVKGVSFNASSRQRIQEWIDALQSKGVTASLRRSRGTDVFGACGQLAEF